ncbi:MAG TPA: acetylesterase [Verrucomicrobiales bacterium]|nr:acetylesterase [Verrucomicrobiales bacterium]
MSLSKTFLLTIALASQALAAPKGKMTLPDFTKGDPIPNGANHDWNLGATGARGWMFSDKMVTSDARQIKITKVAEDSPAIRILKIGDVILGVNEKIFSYDPRTELGKALTAAEAKSGLLSLLRWRDGKTEKVVLKLPILGSYSATAPYNCPKSKRIFEEGCRSLADRISDLNYKPRAITRSLNALALLASGNPDYIPLVRKEANWAKDYTTNGYKTWHYGYVIMLLSEYVMATGDQSVMPGLKRLAMEAAEGQSIVGSWGHKFALEDGRLGGYGMMNAPALPLTTSLVMARAAGVTDPALNRAIKRSAMLLRFYEGKGAIPYGDHHPWTQTHEDNGKCGMAAVLFNLMGEKKPAEFFSRMALASHGPERDGGHTGNFFNILWSLPAVAQSGPHATGAWMKEFGSWYFDLARRHDHSFPHQGPAQMKNDSYNNWDCTGGYLLAYAMPLRKIWLTGKRPSVTPQLNATSAQKVILDGRGWTNKDRNSAYDKLDPDSLLESLGSWSPTVRERAAMALARRKNVPINPIIKMIDSTSLYARYGACQALAHLKTSSPQAVATLRKQLKHEDLWLRVKAAEALAHIGQPAMGALPELLTMTAKGPTPKDPRAMEQRYLSFAVFGKLLRKSLDGVDEKLLQEAIVAGLQNQDGRARGTIGGIYQKLSYEKIKPLLPSIHEAIVTPAPSGIMFASGVRISGLEVLATHRIKEGLPLCLEVMELTKWGKNGRIKRCLDALEKYGPAAKSLLPKLKQLEEDLSSHREAKMLKSHTERVRKIIQSLEETTDKVELRSIE